MFFVKSFLNKKIIIALPLFFAVFFGSTWQVEKRIQADEWIWVPLGVMFVDHIRSGNFQNTQLSTRPGVTVRWISGTTTHLAEHFASLDVKRVRGLIYVEPRGYVINRIVFGGLAAFLTAVLFLLLGKLLSWSSAFLVATFIGLHPITLLKGAVAWTDLLLAFLMILSLVCYILFWEKGERSFLIASGVLFGLSIATKAAGITLLPIFFLSGFLTKPSIEAAKRSFYSSAGAGLIGLVTFFLIYPYLWQRPFGFLDRYGELAKEITAEGGVRKGFSILYYPEVLFKIDPVLTAAFPLFLIWSLVHFIKNRSIPLVILTSAVATIVYLAVLVFVSNFTYVYGRRIASERYIGPAIYFMILFLIGAISYLTKKGFRFLWLVPAAMFLFNLYNLFIFLPSEASGG